jgi:transcriptional regulator with GAF, ATPase, and Fis domain
VSLNCAAVPGELIESELFGHEKGAFTGAIKQKVGQVRARAQRHAVPRRGRRHAAGDAGQAAARAADRRARARGRQRDHPRRRPGLSATNKDLLAEIAAGRFREDLYYRLNVVPLHAPPLRERRSDIPLLVERFLGEAARNRRKRRAVRSRDGAARGHDYPGNVRELRNLVERIVILAAPGEEVLDEREVGKLLPIGRKSEPSPAYEHGRKLSELVDEAERAIVVAALEAHGGVVAEAARSLGVERSNFHKKLKALGIRA